MVDEERWPALPWEEWKDTCDTLHLWTQVVGKVKMRLAPFLNQWWGVGFFVTPRGLTTGFIPAGDRAFEVLFDLIGHNVVIAVSDGQIKALPLYPRSVADFYGEFMAVLRALGIEVSINTTPSEIPNATPFDQDREHDAYDPAYARRFHQILIGTTAVFQRYRSPFAGKSSPVLFYWGSFDLNESRFSGKPATPPDGPHFYQVAENQENVAAGFWPGNPNSQGVTYGKPAFYSYIYPAPVGIEKASIAPAAAHFDSNLGEFILDYDDVRRSNDPAGDILRFFQSTYEAGASLAGWDRAALERTE